MTSRTPPSPEAVTRSGRLEVVPVPNLLYRLYRAGVTGTLALTHGTLRHTVDLHQGQPVSVKLGGDAVEFLGRILLELGKIDDAIHQKSLRRVAETKRLHGEILLEMRAITEADLVQGLQVQARRKLHRLFYLESGTYALEGRDSVPMAAGAKPIPIISSIVHGIRSAYDEERLGALLRSLVGLEVRLAPDFAAREAEFELSPVEQKWVKSLGEWTPVSELKQSGALPAHELRRLLAALVLTESLDLRDEVAAWRAPRRRRQVEDAKPTRPAAPPRPATGPTRPASASGGRGAPSMVRRPGAPPRRTIATTGRPREDAVAVLLEKEKQIENADFFDILGVKRECSPSELKEAYFRQAKRFHPDRFVTSELRPHRRRAEAVFERVSEAYDTLRSPERLAEYVALLADQRIRGDRRRAQMASQADGQFKRAEELLQQGDFAGAEVFLRRAVELFPEDPEFHGALGWATYQNGQSSRSRRFSGAIRHLLKALELNPRSERAHLALGRIYEAESQREEASRHYQQVLAIKPGHAEAQSALERLRTGWGSEAR